jgi:glycosyltransferase involved in cell wall biosynthesis
MRLAVLSDTRLPTLPVGPHGLGRMAYDLARALHEAGHEVTLFAGMGSQPPEGVRLFEHDREEGIAAFHADRSAHAGGYYDVAIDLSHGHLLSKIDPSFPVLNWLADTECPYEPPNIIVGNKWQAQQVKSSRTAPLGIDVAAYPFVAKPDDYVLYAAKLHPLKGFDIAIDVAREAKVRLVMIGENLIGAALPPDVVYLGPVADNRAFQSYLCHAKALLAPSRLDAGGRVILEAAACGVPTLCFDETGCAGHVAHGISGFVCRDGMEMVEALGDVALIDRAGARAWVEQEHSLEAMAAAVAMYADAVSKGARW